MSFQLLFSDTAPSYDDAAPSDTDRDITAPPIDSPTLVTVESHSSSADDRKSSRGSEDDVYMLKTHGYRKYRFVSRSFLHRNKLQHSDDDLEHT